MKILFLDIDGVLNSEDHFRRVGDKRESYPAGHLDPYAIEILNHIIDATGCKVVISSTWRRGVDHDVIAKNLAVKGFRHVDSVIGSTPVMDSPVKDSKLVKAVERGVEIAAWLSQNKTERFCIVDDDADMAHLMHHLVQTEWKHGLTGTKAASIIERLNQN